MTSATCSVQAQYVARPTVREGRLRCPRCDARLQFDREGFFCLLCGYEYPLEPAELEAYRARARARQMAAAIAAIVLAIEGLAITVGLVVAVLLAPWIAPRRARPRSMR